MSTPTVSIQPVVNWPRSARSGQRYLVSVDVVLAEPGIWTYAEAPYAREEFIIGCVLEGGDAFGIAALGSTNLVLHRFGGTYGAVRFVVTSERDPATDGSDALRLTLLTEGGLPFQTVDLPVLPDDANAATKPAPYTRWTIGGQPLAAPSRVLAPPHAQTAPPALPGRTAQRIALLIGANSTELGGVRNDVDAMAAALSVHGFSQTQLVGTAATRAGILDAYESLIADAGADDAVFVYFTGRGSQLTVPWPPQTADEGGIVVNSIIPVDYPARSDGNAAYGGITTIELDALHARLTAKTSNVVIAYDCAHGGHPVRRVPGSVDALRQPHTDALAEHIERLHRAGTPLIGTANPHVVRLSACGPGESAWESMTVDGIEMGLFTEALANALRDAADVPITWITLIDHIRRRVTPISPQQRPTAAGPLQRLLFRTVEAVHEGSLPVVPAGPDRVRILGAALLNVQIGDEFAVMPAGAAMPDDAMKLGDAVVEEVVATEAWAQLSLQPPATAVPLGARAHRVRAVAPLLPVRLPSPLLVGDILAAVTASPLLRPAGEQEPSEYEVRIDDAGLVTVHDRLGPLSEPVPAFAVRQIVTNLERLARAAALRTFADAPRMTLDVPVTAEYGIVVDGQPRRRPETVYADQRVYVQVTNEGDELVYLSLIDIGVAATVTLLNRDQPSGIRLMPGTRYTFGWYDEREEFLGVPISWPERLDPAHPRAETILALITSEPFDAIVLEQAGVRAVSRPSQLEQLLAQAFTGSPLAVDRTGEPTVRYAVQRIDFLLDPRPAASSPDGMLTAGELRDLCIRIRDAAQGSVVDDDLVERIEAEVERYRELSAATSARAQPPDPLPELLPLMGWLIYEASFDRLLAIRAGFDGLSEAERETSVAAASLIRRLAHVARVLPWPEFAPRALGAIRAEALVESRRDTEVGYDAAWLLHEEAMMRHQRLSQALMGTGRDLPQHRVALDEMYLSLALAETGTALRTVERVLTRWTEEFPLVPTRANAGSGGCSTSLSPALSMQSVRSLSGTGSATRSGLSTR